MLMFGIFFVVYFIKLWVGNGFFKIGTCFVVMYPLISGSPFSG